MAIPKVLLVDDVRLLLELEKNFLRHSSVKILTAGDGEEALNIVKTERPDLIYMDLNMPKMDGRTCCATIKTDPELSSIPVIMVTTAGSKPDEQRCREAGCDDFLTKPIERRIFLEKGRRFIPDIDRREPRVACMTEVALANGTYLGNAASADISVGGLFVSSERNLTKSCEMAIAFNLPGTAVRIEAKGRVAWLNSPDELKKPRLPVGFGIEFVEIDTDSVKAIRSFVERQRLG